MGWRWPFVLVAMPAILAAILMILTTREPERGATEDALKVSPQHTFLCRLGNHIVLAFRWTA
jgi:predicted MFS family arabinose efflux permease